MTDVPLQALAGGSAPRFEGNAIPYRADFYQGTLTRGGVMVGIRLWHGWGKQDGRDVDISWDADGKMIVRWVESIERRFGWHACRDNVSVHPWEIWPGCSGDPIDEVEYLRLLSLRQHAVNYNPDSPFASPRQAVDWLTVKHNIPLKGNPQ